MICYVSSAVKHCIGYVLVIWMGFDESAYVASPCPNIETGKLQFKKTLENLT
jgi:hypothetical protein